MKPALLLLFLFVFAIYLPAQEPESRYEKKSVMITMRDGVKLHTVIFSPKNNEGTLPILITRTPYGVADAASPERSHPELAKEGFIFVKQDIRGRYLSEGTFEMLRMTHDPKVPNSIDESTDTYDSIDWLLQNVANNNGKVGVFGISYDGWTTMMALIDPHPALKAVSEQATPADWFINDDMHHNGAFRLSYGFDYAFMEEAGKTDTLFPFDTYDNYDWYLRLGPLSNVNEKHFKHKIPTWDNFVNHPNYDAFWKRQSLLYRFENRPLTVPTQHVAGWYDQEDFAGPLLMYNLLEKKDQNNLNYIVIGPWNHGGWSRGEGNALGNLQFGVPTSKNFRDELFVPWFNYHLKGKGDGNFAEATIFQTGTNQWKKYDSWTPKQASSAALYFHPNGKLSFEKPAVASTNLFDAFISDPANPVPYRARPIEQTYGPGSRWRTWMTEDQRFVHHRPDVLSWESEVLENDVTISGKVLAQLYASTTASDADWIVKLIDVHPDMVKENLKMSGYQQMVAADVLRGRFRKSLETPLPVKPNEVTAYTVDLLQADHVFKKGHKIMVQVQSTWFPLIDRNPQKFVPNIFLAKASDYVKAEHRVYRSGAFPSRVEVMVLK